MKRLTTHKSTFPSFNFGLKICFLFSFTLLLSFNLMANCADQGGDKDEDGICDNVDNCLDTYNPMQADYDKDGIGDLCDYSHDCEGILSIRRVENLASACSGAANRVIWFDGAYCKEIGNLYFTEYTNGTAKLIGQVQELNGSNISEVNVTFTDRSSSGTPYIGCATEDYVDDWYYYGDFSGTIGGMNVVPNPDHNFQIGFGANVKNDAYGASGWFTLDGIATDFNFDLGDPLMISDQDEDGICDEQDNCVYTANPVQADYDLDGIGDVCDDAHDCTDILSIRRVQNLASACSGAADRVIWVDGAYCKEIGDLYFTEYTNGTAKLTGHVQEVDGNNISEVDVTFTDRSTNGKPYFECASQANAGDWYYYGNFSGTIGGMTVVPNPEHGFQVGFGANVKNDAYGASGWFTLDGIATDFNFDLGEALTCTVTQTIGDKVFYDDNFNGIQNDGEEGVEGVTVNLISAGDDGIFHTDDDEIVDSKETNGNGEYLFTEVPTGTYCIAFVKETLPANYGFTGKDAGDDETVDSDADLDGKTGSFTVAEGQAENLDIDAGIFKQGSIGNKVWYDDNMNGIQDNDEEGVEGVTVNLISAGDDGIFHTDDDEISNTKTTNGNGFYKFNNVEPGTYCLEFVSSSLPMNYGFTAKNAGTNASIDSNADEDGKSDAFTVAAGEPSDLTYDAGIFIQGSIGDRVWRDLNANGIQDEGEEGVPGVFIFLEDELGNELTEYGFRYTGDDGAYLFDNLPLAKYVVRFATPSGFILTGQDAAGLGEENNDALDSDASYLDGRTAVIMLMEENPNVDNVDAGYYLAIDLPVELERFYAEKNSCFTDLKWISAAEDNFSHYEVQWSTSRSDFSTVGNVSTEGGRGTQYYFFTHQNTAENNYYRLKMVDLDGSFEYSDIISINHDCNKAFGMSVYPNPVKKWDAEVSIKFFQEEGQSNIHVVDAMGKIVRSFAPALAEYEWNLLDLDVSDLPSGSYYIMIDGNRQAGKFILTE